MAYNAQIDQLIISCWHRGDSIAEARRAVQRAYGVTPGFEQIRTIFVTQCDLWTRPLELEFRNRAA